MKILAIDALTLDDQSLLRIATGLAGGVLWGLLILGYYGFIHRPIEHRSHDQQSEISQFKIQLKSYTNIYATNHQLKESLQHLRDQIATVHRRLPNAPREANFLSNTTRIAEDEQLNIIDFQRGEITEYDDYSEVKVVIRGQGSYPSVCRFLDRVNKLERLSTVSQMTIDSTSNSEGYPFEVHYALQFGMKTSNGTEEFQNGGKLL